ncbi:MAG: hypothetical protein QOF76_2475 [Solirubrobacteraceae bacterium]|jgi:hypothetical protein|nr:hypothetical protein [Solirubrobacteraceae bacterium]
MLWQVITAANVAIAIAYFCIAWIIFAGLRATGQLGNNKLATATALIFFTCAVHHGSHAVHMLLPSFGVHDAKALALRNAWHWETAAWDIFGAAVAVYYLSLRGSYGSVLRGAQMFEDFKVRERQAIEINDNIVQGLAVARMALDSGDDADTRVAIEDTLRRAQDLISELLAVEEIEALEPGDLRRSRPASLGQAP